MRVPVTMARTDRVDDAAAPRRRAQRSLFRRAHKGAPMQR